MMRTWLLAAGLLLCAQAAQALDPGDTPPPLLGQDRDGQAVDLARLRGKVVIVTFWASWCGYCLKELPALNHLQAQSGDQVLKIIAVNVRDEMADYRVMMKQMRDYKLTMTRDRDGGIAASYGVKSYPNLWLIDPQGRIAGHHVGYGEGSLASIIDEIKRLLYAELARQQAAAAAG
jgi:thiol-disulfide isomerase/thioredoxin